jgi:hypothetical protein
VTGGRLLSTEHPEDLATVDEDGHIASPWRYDTASEIARSSASLRVDCWGCYDAPAASIDMPYRSKPAASPKSPPCLFNPD